MTFIIPLYLPWSYKTVHWWKGYVQTPYPCNATNFVEADSHLNELTSFKQSNTTKHRILNQCSQRCITLKFTAIKNLFFGDYGKRREIYKNTVIKKYLNSLTHIWRTKDGVNLSRSSIKPKANRSHIGWSERYYSL